MSYIKNSSKKLIKTSLSIAICLSLNTLAAKTFASTCYDNGSLNGVVVAAGGSECTINGNTYYGNNVVLVYDDKTELKFSEDNVKIQSVSKSTYALSVGGRNGGSTPISPGGAKVEAKNLTVIASPGANSRGIFLFEGTADKNNILHVKNNLDISTSASSGAALQMNKYSSLKVDGNFALTPQLSDGIRNFGGIIDIGKNLTITSSNVQSSNKTAISNSGGIITVTGMSTFNNTSLLNTAIYNNNGYITFIDNVKSTNDKIAIQNDNSSINFFGLLNQFDGAISNNNATINLSNYDPVNPIKGTLFGNLTVGGNYSGTDGILQIDTKLDSDSESTDFIQIGGNATGSTELKVINAGGTGAKTVNGIHVIQTGSSDSKQTFYLADGAISVGAYDYLLNLKKQETTADGIFDNWYLESKLKQDGGEPDIPVYTPDVGEYLAAETMGNTLFTSRLEDREGASQYQNLGNKDTGNVWVRAYGGHNQFKSMQDQLKTKGNSFVTQIGTGLVTLGEEDQYNLGTMTGFAYYDGKTRSNLTNRESKTKINGYSLGLYGTWYAHPVEKRGAYIDSWVLWNKFNNKIDTADQNQYKYDSSGITASIEAGGDYLLNKNGKKDWWIQPQAQLIYQGVHADDFKDAQGVDINHGKDNIQARMGVKTYLNIPTNGNKLTSYRPYVALNFIHNTNPYSVVINDIRYENEGSANLGEFKLGVEGNVTKNSQVWLNASYVAGSHSNQAYQSNIGWKYNF